jgi:hypothetical protein
LICLVSEWGGEIFPIYFASKNIRYIFDELKTTNKMKYNQLSISEVMETMEIICEEYSSFIDETCKDEVLEKFFDYYVNVSLSGMTQQQAHDFVDVLEFLFLKQVKLQTQE